MRRVFRSEPKMNVTVHTKIQLINHREKSVMIRETSSLTYRAGTVAFPKNHRHHTHMPCEKCSSS